MKQKPYDYSVVEALLGVLCKITCVRVIKPSGNRSWELCYGNLKTYNEGIIIKQIGGKQ